MASSSKDNEPQPQPPTQAGGPIEDDIYFMAVALMFAKKSPDPNTKVGACIVNQKGNIVGIGYNKMPNGCEDEFSWERGEHKDPKKKYLYVCHAELNAIMNKTSMDVKGCTIYVTLYPCNECAKLIIQSGIKGVVYLSNKHKDYNETKAAVKLFRSAGIEPRQFLAKREVADFLASIDPFAE
ncbi:deoxycytidylate deaminase [Pangasianodon hypophthalmus]|uniref:deoxycytidylate deaminase n=1 Tax=Pangasianodon hypophthalmus TaxID=310915 RepID=UPI002308030B|nr:deoxycytidylate deaminase [Pangasianodon hypophthalmus]